jgi:hypothetical protein
MTTVIKNGNESKGENANVEFNANAVAKEMSQIDNRQAQRREEEERIQAENQRQRQKEEEEIRNNGRLQLLQLQTEGKRFFKPIEDFPYLIAFDRAAATKVKGVPNEKFTNTFTNKDGTVVQRHPIEWIHKIRHENGIEQTWTITNKECATSIVMRIIEGFSVLRITKRVPKKATGDPDKNKTYYDVVGVR